MIYTTHYDSPLGDILLAERDGGLIGLWIEGQSSFLPDISEEIGDAETPTLKRAKKWLDRYFAGDKPSPGELNLTPRGSAFRLAVWEILRGIKYGEVITYGEIAKQIAAREGCEKMSAQAVGGAVGHNQISIIIPCHRVVGAGGNLTGYAGGIDKKIALLTHEGLDMTKYYIPKV